MGKHLKKFNTQEQIESALSNGSLLKPYVALYNNKANIDYNTILFTHFSNILTSNNIDYSIDGDLSWSFSGATINEFNYIKINDIPLEIKNYILNGNHNRWHILETPVHLNTLTKENESSSSTFSLFTDENYNEINMIKYDENTDTLYLSSGNFYGDKINSEILNIENIIQENINGWKIFYDNSVNDFVMLGVEILNVETNNYLSYDGTGDGDYDLNIYFIPQILINYIENYLNNTWDGTEVTLENSIYTGSSYSLANYGGNGLPYIVNKVSIVTITNSDFPSITEPEERLLVSNPAEEIYIYINLITLQLLRRGASC